MISNTQKRAGAGNSLNKATLQVVRAVTAGQDLYINEAGDIAPSTWFTGTPTYLDNLADSNFGGSNARVMAGDVCSFDESNMFVAYVVGVTTGEVNTINVKKIDPITGQLVASLSAAVPGLSGLAATSSGNYVFVQVVPVSATVVSVIVRAYDSSLTSFQISANKYTVSGTTFTASGWSTTVTTPSVSAIPNGVMFSGVTGTANRWGFQVAKVTDTTAVCYIYKHATNTITAVSLSFASSADLTNSNWAILEGTDNLVAICSGSSAAFVKYINGTTAATGNSNTVSFSSIFVGVTGMVSTSATQLQVSGYKNQANRKYPHTVQALTISTDMATLTLGAAVNLPLGKILKEEQFGLVAYAAGQYIFSNRLRRELLQPTYYGSGIGATVILMVKGTVSAPSIVQTDMLRHSAPSSMRIEEANWSPVAAKRLRCIYCPYYKAFRSRAGFSDYLDSSNLLGDIPFISVPELVYAISKNALAYVGSAVADIAQGASGAVVLSTGAVKLNNNLAPVKSIRNGVIAVSQTWGVKLPAGQRNDGTFDAVILPALISQDTGVANQGGALIIPAAEGEYVYIENQRGAVDVFVQSYLEAANNASRFHVFAIVDGRAMCLTVKRDAVLDSNGISLKLSFSFNDHLMFCFTPGTDITNTDTQARKMQARLITTKLEAKYYE